MLISDNLSVRKSYFDSNIITGILRHFFFLQIILKWTSTEAHVYMRRHHDVKVKHFDISNMIYHIFSHSSVYYTLNGENVNIMLECSFSKSYPNFSIAMLTHLPESERHGLGRRGK